MYVTKQKTSDIETGRDRPALSPEALEEFKCMFLDWMQSDWNLECLEAGAPGDVATCGLA